MTDNMPMYLVLYRLNKTEIAIELCQGMDLCRNGDVRASITIGQIERSHG
jgi:hypothetical protein